MMVPKQHPQVLFDQCRGACQVRAMSVKVDSVGHGPALMTQELRAVLWRNDPYRVRREAMAKRVDRHRRKTRSPEDDCPCLIEPEERSSGLVS
jgi:hypothetical protein